MSRFDRDRPHRPVYSGGPFGRRLSALVPWTFVVGVVVAVVLVFRHGSHSPLPRIADSRSQQASVVLRQSGGTDGPQPVDVVRTIDGDTFLARIRRRDAGDLVVSVRLRGIDAPELKASCAEELDKAEAAADALRNLLAQGGVTISNLGEDKYGRLLADVATRRTASVSAELLAGGFARSYDGGHRDGWCARGWRFR